MKKAHNKSLDFWTELALVSGLAFDYMMVLRAWCRAMLVDPSDYALAMDRAKGFSHPLTKEPMVIEELNNDFMDC